MTMIIGGWRKTSGKYGESGEYRFPRECGMVDTWPPGSTRGFERQVVLRASRTTSLNGDTVIRGHVGVDAPREESFFRNRLITPIYGPSRPASTFLTNGKCAVLSEKREMKSLSLSLSRFILFRMKLHVM